MSRAVWPCFLVAFRSLRCIAPIAALSGSSRGRGSLRDLSAGGIADSTVWRTIPCCRECDEEWACQKGANDGRTVWTVVKQIEMSAHLRGRTQAWFFTEITQE